MAIHIVDRLAAENNAREVRINFPLHLFLHSLVISDEFFQAIADAKNVVLFLT